MNIILKLNNYTPKITRKYRPSIKYEDRAPNQRCQSAFCVVPK